MSQEGIYIEIFGAVTGLFYIFLEIRQRRAMWILGGVSASSYIAIFLNTGFYAAAALQIYYLCASFYGWRKWKKQTGTVDSNMQMTVKISVGTVVISIILAGAGVLFIWYGLEITDSDPMPAMDALIAALSMMATYWIANRFIESWFVWIAADMLAAYMYFVQGLYPTTILYAVYTIGSIAGYFHWRKFHKIIEYPKNKD